MRRLTSLQNSFIKSLLLLKEKSKSRKQTGTFLIEGRKEILLSFKGGYEIEKILFYPKLCSKIEVEKWSEGANLIEISKEIFEKLAYRKSTEGVIAVAQSKVLSLSKLELGSAPLILIAESIEKPGNIGALLRTADAANLDAVIIANPKGDLYNPNVVRSSIGCLFTNQIAIAPTSEVISFLRENKIAIYCAALEDAVSYDSQDYTIPSAIVVGAEATGLSKEWKDVSTEDIVIPMQGAIDSMNVSVSAGILIFEAKRQRGF